MWIQQKMVTAPAMDPKQRQMTQMTTLMMPLMFGMFCLSFPSGLALYWVFSNIIGIIIQYFVSGGWGYLSLPSGLKFSPARRLPQEQESKTIKKAYEKKKGLFKK
jgi:membrane protein insertase Oxa1/YidC/SpoIIIJ